MWIRAVDVTASVRVIGASSVNGAFAFTILILIHAADLTSIHGAQRPKSAPEPGVQAMHVDDVRDEPVHQRVLGGELVDFVGGSGAVGGRRR